MTQQQKYHNKKVCEDNNNNNIEESFVDEICQCCGKRMTNIKYIYYDLDYGDYICKECSKDYDNVVKVKDL